MIEKRLINIRELSEWTGFTEGTLYQWAHMGKIPCVRPNGSRRCLRFDVIAIEEWIQTNSSEASVAGEKSLTRPTGDVT
ncbi:MAG: helix-turn-helix domain-containing protein [Acidobacteriia bacterium]|nr:helix-turn-helix domain-containing protein [Terriglobia bacterium]